MKAWDVPQQADERESTGVLISTIEVQLLLQILSLHNCTKLRSTALSAIAGGCPQLRILMLGGCSLALTPSPGSSSGVAKVAPLQLSTVKLHVVHVHVVVTLLGPLISC